MLLKRENFTFAFFSRRIFKWTIIYGERRIRLGFLINLFYNMVDRYFSLGTCVIWSEIENRLIDNFFLYLWAKIYHIFHRRMQFQKYFFHFGVKNDVILFLYDNIEFWAQHDYMQNLLVFTKTEIIVKQTKACGCRG